MLGHVPAWGVDKVHVTLRYMRLLEPLMRLKYAEQLILTQRLAWLPPRVTRCMDTEHVSLVLKEPAFA